MTAQQKIASKVSNRSTNSLKEMAGLLFADMRDGADVVLSAVMDELMARLPEAEFVAFCEAM